MRAFPIAPISYGELASASAPSDARQPEAYSDILFDTQTYLDASTTELTFFGTAQANATLSNMAQGGSLGMGNYFSIDHITVDLWPDAGWTTTTAGGVAGLADDIGLLLYQGRPVYTLTLDNKPYGQWPLLAAGGMGGVSVFGYGTFTAEESLQFGQVKCGGHYIGQSLVIPPLVNWNFRVQWAAAQNLTDDYRVRLSLHGTRYRKVR
jgi:hypothetical protein